MLDLVVIGGGVNGTGVARDAAGRGLRVLLCEQGDLASATSQASSKLIHGGLRYLEHGEFRLVRQALRERELLLRNAPHLVAPMRFVLPMGVGARSALVVQAGLWLYDLLCGRTVLPRSRRLDLTKANEGAALQPSFRTGFAYSDCFVDDARLVLANALDARRRSADVLTRTRCVAVRRQVGCFAVSLEDLASGRVEQVLSRVVVNTAGPWVMHTLQQVAGISSSRRLRLVKGSHIVVPRLYPGEHSYLLQNDDGRVVFVIPFERDFTMIGTTEVDFAGDPGQASCSAAETTYLCATASSYLRAPIQPEAVVWSFAGVRPLFDDGRSNASAVTRDYAFELDVAQGAAMLSVFGGKLTTYRRLAERAVDRLRPFLPHMRGGWTHHAVLPGGDLPAGNRVQERRSTHLASLRQRYRWLDADTLAGIFGRHGSHSSQVIGAARCDADLGLDFGGGLREAEMIWMMQREWAQSVEDVLWRRSKLGLRLTGEARDRLERWLELRRAVLGAPVTG